MEATTADGACVNTGDLIVKRFFTGCKPSSSLSFRKAADVEINTLDCTD
jgi:hypothetical protein